MPVRETPVHSNGSHSLTSYQQAWKDRFRQAAHDSARLKAMLRDEAAELACWLGETYGVNRVWLFGSLVDESRRVTLHTDIDLAAEGLPPRQYYGAVGRLLSRASRRVDLVEIESAQPALVEKIRATGVLIFERH